MEPMILFNPHHERHIMHGVNMTAMKIHMLKNVAKRIELLTGVPEANSENLQLLKDEVGQFYKTQ